MNDENLSGSDDWSSEELRRQIEEAIGIGDRRHAILLLRDLLMAELWEAYTSAGAPLGMEQKGADLWLHFGEWTTVN